MKIVSLIIGILIAVGLVIEVIVYVKEWIKASREFAVNPSLTPDVIFFIPTGTTMPGWTIWIMRAVIAAIAMALIYWGCKKG